MIILLTIGHHSSAIALTNDGKMIAGYEEERFTRNKGEVGFPINSIVKILEQYKIKPNEDNKIYKSQEGDSYYKEFTIKRIKDLFIFPFSKHNDIPYIKKIVRPLIKYLIKHPKALDPIIKGNFKMMSNIYNHHENHAGAVSAFVKNTNYHILVADGVGDNEDVLVLYKVVNNKYKVIYKINGIAGSYGLLFDDACIYCNMKPSNDEYKFLGYESKIKEILDDDTIKKFKKYGQNKIRTFLFNKRKEIIHSSEITFKCFDNILKFLDDSIEINEFSKRVLIGFTIQSYVEKYIIEIVKKYNIKNLLVCGGLFYNVKLNNLILKSIPGKFSICPIAGDQGNSIGMYFNYGNEFDYGDLCWGKRNLKLNSTKNINYFTDKKSFINLIVKKLINDEIINIITGNMEFGPRALCNTSTLALPTKENLNEINKINNRNTIMPMSPVLLERNMDYFFNKNQYSRVIKSDEFMIITYDYKKEISKKKYGGVMHKYPMKDIYSGRPQVIKEKTHWMYNILNSIEIKTGYKSLINTSFNIHGKSICYDLNQAQEDYIKQKNRATKKINLFIGNF